ncbi:hypothetical protein F511_43299 [Dorcoceras hygrometricum]|uniref:Uncharacterized protein n=1 Tax=Dorcoceras hygrometricum TaxID=472368 RepID=A0A2Z7ANQ3_9LAMI|nr:hypothetical protein F511_43299 [Dorcoceras hygrometricum]
MASSTFTNAYLVDFESVLNIPDNDGMQNMFKALESSGLRGFLGCKSVLYEPELEHFFDTALIQGGDITGAISGKYISISPSRFAGVFELPTEGLSDFFDVPKNLVYVARKLFSKSGEPVVPHGKKKLLKYEYSLLNDILAKSITVKAGSFDAVTNERFQMMTAIHFGLKVNWSKSDEGGKTPVAIVKRASKSKKKSESTSDATVEIVSEVVGSKKRPAGAVPLQVIEPTPAVTAAQPPAPKRKSRKRKLIRSEGSDDDNIEENIDGEPVKVAGTGTQGRGDRPAELPLGPAWLPEVPANGQHRPKQKQKQETSTRSSLSTKSYQSR